MDLWNRSLATLHSPERLNRIIHLFIGWILFSIPKRWRRYLFSGDQYYCPICQSRLRSFLVLYRSYNLWCPVCKSLQRHRLSWLLLERTINEMDQESKIHFLHIAPEESITAELKQNPRIKYLSADLNNPDAMIKMDISDIHFRDNYFDFIYCSHVLEHVPDDQKALREFHRTLKPKGRAMILVPIFGEETIEDPSITDPVQRQEMFGQHDHVRKYGADFSMRLVKAGFSYKVYKIEDLVNQEDSASMGINIYDIIYLCRKIEE